jgi:5-formyltetrahydrofolate cyclo-ligase
VANNNPQSIRKRINRQRRCLSPAEQRQAALQLAHRLSHLPDFIRSRRIAAYLAVNGEMSLQPVIDMALSMNKEIYLPVLLPFMEGRLWFARYRHGDKLVRNRFGIPEPLCHHRNMISAHELDQVLTPLVAYDVHCQRLGMGGGFYDRTFAFLLRRRYWKKPRMTGIAHDFQKVGDLPVQAWDIPLDNIITENNIYSR